VLKFINYVVDAVFSVFDGALDFVVNIITAAIFDAIPGLRTYSEPWILANWKRL